MNLKKTALWPLYFSLILSFGQTLTADNTFQPAVSILTSVWKGDEFIEHFLIDITRQTIFDQCELIIINANSPGHEDEIIEKYAHKYPNIVYKKLTYDPGLYGVWNIAIGMARAEYLVNANLDDRMAPNFLEVHAQELKKHPEVDLVYSDTYWTHKPNETFENNSGTHRFHPLGHRTPEFSIPMAALLPGCHPMWRKSLHTKAGLFDEKFLAIGDHDMWWRAVKAGSIFKKINGVFGLYYSNPNGLSTAGYIFTANDASMIQNMSPEMKKRHDKVVEELTMLRIKYPEFPNRFY